MGQTFKTIATVTVGSGGASSIDFTSIPSSYDDLMILHSIRGSAASNTNSCNLRFNSATTNYSEKLLYTLGTSVATASSSNNLIGWIGIPPGNSATASVFGSGTIYISGYASSNYKPILTDSASENNATGSNAWAYYSHCALWSNSSAITSISVFPDSGTFLQYSTATLFGIKNS